MANGQEMIELPELVILQISQQLSYEDLRNLRVTCKKLKATREPFEVYTSSWRNTRPNESSSTPANWLANTPSTYRS